MKLPVLIAFDWDKGNFEKSWKRHKVYFKEAEEVFFNKPLKTFKDAKHSQKEDRFVALGATDKGRKLYTVFTVRKGKVRIISTRDQSRKEKRLYAKKESSQ